MAAKPPQVRILHCTPLKPSTSVKALLRIQIGEMTFNQCRLILPASDSLPYVQPPRLRWIEDGERRFLTLCVWPKSVRTAVNEAARRFYQMESDLYKEVA